MSLKVWLPLNGDLHNQGTSNPNISLVSGNTWASSGKIGSSSLTLTKLQTILSTSSCMTGAKEVSYSYWVKVNTAWSANWLDGIRWTETNGSATSTARQEFYTNCTLIGTWYKGGSISGKAFTPGVWTHLAATINYNTGEAKFYINGILSGTTTNVDTTYYCRGDFYIGDSGTDICENDVRIYDHCLSAAEVHEISQGLVLHYKLDTQYFKSGTNLVTDVTKGRQTTKLTDGRLGVVTSGTNADTYFTINLSESITNGTTYHFSCDASGISEGQFWNFPLGAQNNTSLPCKIYNGHNEFVFTANDINWGTNRLFMDDLNRTDWEHPATFYNFILTKDATYEVQDSSGYGHNGSILNAPTISSDTGRYSSSLNLNGTTDGILIENLPLSNIINTEVTYSFWIKPNGENGARSVYFGSYSGTSWSIEKTTGNVLRSYWMGSPDETCSGAIITDGVWQHVCITKKGTSDIKVYINGIQKWSSTATHNNLTFPTTFRIGRDTRSSDGTPYKGLMSDFRIYATALSADDIKQLYQVGAKVDNLQNLHTFEIKETNRNLLAGRLWSNWYSQHNPNIGLFTNFNSKGEYQFTANGTSAGSEYIPINPSGHTYEYDYTISVNAGNQFYIGFERYDADKTARSNNACTYTYATKPSTDVIKQHYKGTVNLSTDGTNPCAFIALRILNGWSGTTSGVTGTATIHSFSLREIGTKQQPKLKKTGTFIEEELKEETATKLHKNGIVETNNLIEF